MAEVPKKILCIEDDRETARLIANELSERGFYVVIAYSSRVGLAAILKRIPDLILCDVGLPEMSGFEILATINGSPLGFKRIPFIFLTGWTARHDELKGRSLGADDYVTKPIDFDILEEIIRARLMKGLVRHEMSPRPPKPFREARRGAFPGAIAPRQILELTDAPTVDWHLDQESADRAADGAPGLIIKP